MQQTHRRVINPNLDHRPIPTIIKVQNHRKHNTADQWSRNPAISLNRVTIMIHVHRWHYPISSLIQRANWYEMTNYSFAQVNRITVSANQRHRWDNNADWRMYTRTKIDSIQHTMSNEKEDAVLPKAGKCTDSDNVNIQVTKWDWQFELSISFRDKPVHWRVQLITSLV